MVVQTATSKKQIRVLRVDNHFQASKVGTTTVDCLEACNVFKGVVVILPGARWECPQCHRFSHTPLGCQTTTCEHCGLPLDVVVVTDCLATLAKVHYQAQADDIRQAIVLPMNTAEPVLQMLALSTASNLLSGGR